MASKTIHSLALPYTAPSWPEVSPDTEATILKLLIPLLQPIGEYRRKHVQRSRGKGRGKRKLEDVTVSTDDVADPVWMPDIYDHLTIGYNSTTRRLEALSRSTQVNSRSSGRPSGVDGPCHLAAVLVCRSSLPDIVTESLPLLVAAASAGSSNASAPVRLVALSEKGQSSLSESLQQSSVAVLGLQQDAPGMDGLIAFVREVVKENDVPWIQEASAPRYLSAKIRTVESSAAERRRADKGKKRRKHKPSVA